MRQEKAQELQYALLNGGVWCYGADEIYGTGQVFNQQNINTVLAFLRGLS